MRDDKFAGFFWSTAKLVKISSTQNFHVLLYVGGAFNNGPQSSDMMYNLSSTLLCREIIPWGRKVIRFHRGGTYINVGIEFKCDN